MLQTIILRANIDTVTDIGPFRHGPASPNSAWHAPAQQATASSLPGAASGASARSKVIEGLVLNFLVTVSSFSGSNVPAYRLKSDLESVEREGSTCNIHDDFGRESSHHHRAQVFCRVRVHLDEVHHMRQGSITCICGRCSKQTKKEEAIYVEQQGHLTLPPRLRACSPHVSHIICKWNDALD